MKLNDFIFNSPTPYHAADNAAEILSEAGFTRLYEGEKWQIQKGKGYFTVKDGSAIIAFKAGEEFSFNIAASHSDSPCFKLKKGTLISDNYKKFNVEKYGGGIIYSWLDRPLTVAGRLIVKDGDALESVLFKSKHNFVIPSVAIHFNRNVNDGVKFDAQRDTSAIESILDKTSLESEISEFTRGNEVVDADLYLVCDERPFVCGAADELISTPRADDLTSAFASIKALEKSAPKAINVVFIANNEEVGSMTKAGAASTFLSDVLRRVALALGKTEEDYACALDGSFMLSCDNAHAVHPNKPELSDPASRVGLGGGVVIKHHGNMNYTTDGFSSAVIKTVFDKANVKYQDFYMRSDLPCGGTLGAISGTHVSIRSADIGIAQLAMHSAVETFAATDETEIEKGLTAFFSVAFRPVNEKFLIVW